MIHVLRPYASEQEYLAAERTSIDSKSMLLIDQPPLAVDTTVVFDVTLSNGEKPIRAEGKVIECVTANDGRPGGLRVRFRRFGAATKAFIGRAVNDAPPQVAAPEVTPAASGESDSSGVHRKLAVAVAAPSNREALLERLRARRAG